MWIYLAMDACSRFAMHYSVAQENNMDYYLDFIGKLVRQHDLGPRPVLAIDLDAEHRSMIMEAYPEFVDVICDKKKVAVVTEEFHRSLLANAVPPGLN